MKYAGSLFNIKWRLSNSSTCSSFCCVSITELSENFRIQHVPRLAYPWLAAVITFSEINYTQPSFFAGSYFAVSQIIFVAPSVDRSMKLFDNSKRFWSWRKKSSSSHHNISAKKKKNKKNWKYQNSVIEKLSVIRGFTLFVRVLERNHREKARDEGTCGHKQWCSSGLKQSVFLIKSEIKSIETAIYVL